MSVPQLKQVFDTVARISSGLRGQSGRSQWVHRSSSSKPDICHGHHGRCPWRKICHVEKFHILYMTNVEKSQISPHVEWFKISSHERCGEIWYLLHCVYNLWYFVAFYTVLLQNSYFFWLFTVFCRKILSRDLRAIVWRKFESKIVPVEKKWQIWGMSAWIYEKIQNLMKHLNYIKSQRRP